MLRLARFSTRRPFVSFAVWLAVAAALSCDRPRRQLHRCPRRSSSCQAARRPAPYSWPSPTSGRASSCPCSSKGRRPSSTSRVPRSSRRSPRAGTRACCRRGTSATPARRCARTRRTRCSSRPSARPRRRWSEGSRQDIDRIVDQKISEPVTSYITGTPTIDLATKDQSLDAARRAELLALPILFLVLLILLRAPIAALVLTAFGGATTLMSFGAMALLGKAIDVDPTAVTLASMAGLALGVSYAMLVYRRWRDERSALHAHDRAGDALAASRAVETAGRAVLDRRHGSGRRPRDGAPHRAGHDPDLAGHRRDAVLGARHRRRGGRDAGRDDHPRAPPAGVLVRRPGVPDGAVERARESRRRMGHPQRGRRRRRGDCAARGPRDPDAEPRDRPDLAGAAAEGRSGPRLLREDLRGHGAGVRDAVQHRRGLEGHADHRPRDAAQARRLPGGDRGRRARRVRRRPG